MPTLKAHRERRSSGIPGEGKHKLNLKESMRLCVIATINTVRKKLRNKPFTMEFHEGRNHWKVDMVFSIVKHHFLRLMVKNFLLPSSAQDFPNNIHVFSKAWFHFESVYHSLSLTHTDWASSLPCVIQPERN